MYRWAFDVGEASIGWAVFRLDPKSKEPSDLVDGGVRLFGNSRHSKTNQPLNAERRQARGMRRNSARRLMRKRSVEAWLVKIGLLDSFEHDVRSIDPYFARAKAADATNVVEKPVLARAMLHLAKGRGFKSNRKTDRSEDTEFTAKITHLETVLDGKTLGEWLYARQQSELAQVVVAKQQGKAFHHRKGLRFRGEEGIYPSRKMIEDEFDKIRAAQEKHLHLSEDDWSELRDRIFFQRRLKPQTRGVCTFFPSEPRALKALPSSEAFRIEQQLSNLKFRLPDYSEQSLSPQQRSAVRTKLYRTKNVKFSALLKLKDGDGPVFPNALGFNLETTANTAIAGADTWIRLEAILGADYLAAKSLEQLDELVEALIITDDADELTSKLTDLAMPQSTAVELEKLTFASGTTNLSSKAMRDLLESLKAGLRYDDAVKELKDSDGNPLHHSQIYPEKLPSGTPLPYYGERMPTAVIGGDRKIDIAVSLEQHYGKISNPTVHVGLNQLRTLVNLLIKRYGHPAQIHLELAREIGLSAKARSEIETEQRKNQRENQDLNQLAMDSGCANPTREDRIKLKLWQMGKIARRCVFTGKPISAHQLFNGETEVEHLLPYSRTLDDRQSNKVVVFKAANAVKGNKTPHEAFGNDQHAETLGIKWEEVLQRASSLPGAWSWRFGPEAMERFHKNGNNSFVERSLNDTRYLAKIARQYLQFITQDPVVVVTGQHTANLRHDWQLNEILYPASATKEEKRQKNRGDHRHHLIDAFVIGLTSRRVLMNMARDAKRSDFNGRFKRGYSELAGNLRHQLQDLVDRVQVSVKPDRSASGKILDETAYGLSENNASLEPDRNLVTRVHVENIASNPEKIFGVSKLKGICDPAITNALAEFLAAQKMQGLTEKIALKKFLNDELPAIVQNRGIKRLRVKIADQSAEPVTSAPYKAYAKAEYAFADIWYLPANKRQKTAKYQAVYVDLAVAKQHLEQGTPLPDNLRPDHPGASRKWRVFKNDLVEVFGDEGPEIFRVFGFSATNNILDLRPVQIGEATRNYKSVNKICERGFRVIRVSADGSRIGSNR